MSTKLAQNQRSRRAMEEKAAKLIENPKSLLGIKGPKTSELITSILKDLHKFKSPDSKLLTKRNITRPFEDVSSVEFLGKVNDSSLFTYGSHSKKRPHNLVIGRMFDFQLLDMFELGVDPTTFQDMDSFDGLRKAVVRIGSKPAMLFQGDLWDSNSDLVMLRNLLLDFFRGETLSKINLSALDRMIIVSATSASSNVAPSIHFRHYGVSLKKSSTSSLPRVELDEVGPRMDLTLRRRKSASDELVKESLRQPRQTSKTIFQKNIERNAMGDRVGRVHMQKQDLSNLNIARLKGLRKRKRGDGEEGDGGAPEPDEDGMTKEASTERRSRPSTAPTPSTSATARRMVGVSSNTMDEFASRSSAASVGSSSGRTSRLSETDSNLIRKRAGGYGNKPIEGGYKNVAKKKKLDK